MWGFIEEADGREEIYLGLVVADDGGDVAEAGVGDGVLGLENVDDQCGAGTEVGLGEAEGFLSRVELFFGDGDEFGVGGAVLLGRYDAGSDDVELGAEGRLLTGARWRSRF